MNQLNGVWADLAAAVLGPPSPSSFSRPVATEDAPRRVNRQLAQAADKPQETSAPATDGQHIEALKSAAQHIESYLRSMGRELEFTIDQDTGRTVVSVRDSATGELIRQIPGEETLRLARALGSQPNVLIDQIV